MLEVDENVLTEGLVEKLGEILPPPDMLQELKSKGKAAFDEMPDGERFLYNVRLFLSFSVHTSATPHLLRSMASPSHVF